MKILRDKAKSSVRPTSSRMVEIHRRVRMDEIPVTAILAIRHKTDAPDELIPSLKQEGYRVTLVESGERALELLDTTEFDLVLLYMGAARNGSFEILSGLRQRHPTDQLPIVLICGKASGKTLDKALELGANDVISKCKNSTIALARIRLHVSRRQAERKLRETEERFALAAGGANDGLWDWNLRTNELSFSSRWKMILGHEDDEVGSSPEEWFNRVHPEDITRVKSDLASHLNGQTAHFENEHRMLHKNGTYRWMLCRGLAALDGPGKAARMAGSLTDITEGKVSDALTGLPNRILFLDRLGRTFERAKYVGNYQFAILFLDLDRFKVINDSLGHSIGDQLLTAIALRIKGCLHSADTVARLGGDEFTVLLEDIGKVGDAARVAERIQKELAVPFSLSGHEIYITASIGIAMSDRSYDRPEDLLRDADIAMYRAKGLGRGRCELFDTDMRDQAVARLRFENDLRRALLRQEFEVYYQPIVSLETDRLCGFEALVRWVHPSRGLIFPAQFVPIAEETGLIVPICRWVLREACQQTKLWQERYPSTPPLMVCVNFSCKQFLQPDLARQISQALEETGLSATSLKLEISESVIVENARSSNDLLQQLSDLGIRLFIDDFGTSNTSFFSLHRFPIDTLKIHRSFISSIGMENKNRVLVRTIVRLAQDLGVKVVAVGVENAAQLEQLRSLGCEFGQGYFFSSPVDAAGATDIILRQKGE